MRRPSPCPRLSGTTPKPPHQPASPRIASTAMPTRAPPSYAMSECSRSYCSVRALRESFDGLDGSLRKGAAEVERHAGVTYPVPRLEGAGVVLGERSA